MGKSDLIHAGWVFTRVNSGTFLLSDALLERLKIDPPVPSASIYSQTDGVVAWRGCRGTESPHHRNIEVNGVSHMGMIHHPEVLRVVANLLARQG